MLGTEASLALYYLGFGFVIFLGWAAVSSELNTILDIDARARMRRLAIALAVVGLAHPACALAGLDVAAQLGRIDGPPTPTADRLAWLTRWGVALSATIAALVIAAHLDRFDGLPVLLEIRERSPFS